MANNDFVKEITNIDEDFAQWYTDIVLKAELADYSATKGCIVIRPYGYEIWEKIQEYTDKKFKETGVKNTSFPILIPESLLQKEKDHVEGFAPEVAWVTNAGGQDLEESKTFMRDALVTGLRRYCSTPNSMACLAYSKSS